MKLVDISSTIEGYRELEANDEHERVPTRSIIEELENLPEYPIELEKVGRWQEYGASYTMVGGVPAKCNVCGKNNLRYRHCPNCGARMSGRDMK